MRRRKPILLSLAEALLTAIFVTLFIRTFLFQAFSIPTGSMERNLQVGDKILVNKFIYSEMGPDWLVDLLPARSVRRGDVVVFRYPVDPDRDYIKRCVAGPGDTVEISRRRLSLDGVEIDESNYTYFTDDRIFPPSVALPEVLRFRDHYGPYRLGEESYFCLGDNRNNSNDSRYWGAVPQANVRGRAWLIYWSNAPEQLEEPELASRAEELAPSSGSAAESETETPEAEETVEERRPIRWDRMLQVVR